MCPVSWFSPVQSHLPQIFEDTNKPISFKQLVSVDKTELITQTFTVQEYVDLLLSNLKPWPLISHAQSAHLKQLNETMNKDTALTIMDFAKNYSFHI